MYRVKWCDMWLAPFGWAHSDDSRSNDSTCAKEFNSLDQAERRIARVMKLRDCSREEFKIIGVSV